MAHAFQEVNRIAFRTLIEESLGLRAWERTARDQLLQDGLGHWEVMSSPLYIVEFDANSVNFDFIEIRDFDIPNHSAAEAMNNSAGMDKLFSVVKSTIGTRSLFLGEQWKDMSK